MHTNRFLSFARAAGGLALAATTAFGQALPTWRETTPTALIGGAKLYGLAHGHGTFVVSAAASSAAAGGAADFALTSADGAAWTRHALPGPATGIRQVRFVNGRFWTVGGDGGGRSTVYQSTDGAAWTAVQTVTVGGIATGGGLIDLAHGNGLYIAPLDLGWLTSPDGVNWTARPTPTPVGGSLSGATGVAFANGVFVASFASVSTTTSMFRSADGLTWTPIPALTSFGGYSRVFAFGGRFVVYERSNTNVATFGQALVSADGLTWTRAGATNNATASSGVTGVGASYRVTAAGVSGLGTFRIATTVNDATFTEIGVMPFNRNVDRGFAVGESAIVGFTSTDQIVVGAAPVGAPVAPTIATQPASQSAAAGSSATFAVTASGGGLSFQWLFNGNAIAGATAASYAINGVTSAHAGSYAVRIANSAGTITSQSATLTVTAAEPAGSYLGNLSIRSTAGSGAQTLIVGVTVGGAGTSGEKRLLVRGIGPALGGFGLTGALADPKLAVYSGSTVVASNDNWDATATPLATQSGAGAFALTAGSRDAALIGNTTAGGYTIQITDAGGTTGIALAELYDLTPAASFTSATPRLINLSARTQVGTGADILIAGFNVGGSGQRRLLIRAIGPGLTPFGLTGGIADPKLEIYSGSTVVAANDNWDAAATPLATQSSVGAFGLAAGSRDAVLIVNLAPGSYTAQVSGVGGTTGIGLVELYELP